MVLLAIVGVVIWRRRRRGLGTTKAVDGSLVAFGYKDLQFATKNFSYKLGGGGFGSVFKGTLPDSTVIAVKKLESISQGEKQFRTENFVPKLLILVWQSWWGCDFSRVLTTLRGTRGYLAPEWISGVAITAKADVYSYGMMLFEFISGRRNSEQSENGMVKFFPSFAASVTAEGGDILSQLDPALDGNADAEEVSKICKVACWCIQDEENIRPSMGHVVQILEGVMDVNLPPIPRCLKLFAESQENIMFFTDSSSGPSSQTKSNSSQASSYSKSNTSTN
ncbi:G-type lectin S-receptor-like serine/threonine-protein kinase [Abeliophyllum distichum]|uniref:G-type lectin S-receptor-like serine/threonine-protein kinase n=1 Tax=Abeliophyllum distichum TaxID=126358 RepID=A0ABD1UGM7_9LAMI